MQSFGEIIKKLRDDQGLVLRQVAAALDVDQAIISKFEKGERKPNRDQVLAFAKFFNAKQDDLLIAWLSDKVAYELEDENVALKALQMAEEKVKYQKRKKK
jgi:transcriptional regulator with XRE-family HTH domain